MAKVIQMELAFVGAGAPTPAINVCAADSVVNDTCADFDAMALRQGIVSCFADPCKGCVYSGLCDADDCAMHLFELDVNDPELNCV